ncbi:hypothetical protein Dimus_023261 [Dionaea muscipula]
MFVAYMIPDLDCVDNLSEIALKLEALVGDLEDSVISVLKRRTGDSCSRAPLNLRISTEPSPIWTRENSFSVAAHFPSRPKKPLPAMGHPPHPLS